MSSVLDYIGRTVDMQIFWGVSLQGERLLQQTFATEAAKGGAIVTGIQKLAQRWAVEFLTPKGTIQYEPNRGTTFMTLAQQGFFRTTLDVEQAFSSALIDIKRNLVAEELTTDPNDERYDTAELLAITLIPDLLSITVRIDSLAGTSREVILPITTTVTGQGI